jgi:hypothetical protein
MSQDEFVSGAERQSHCGESYTTTKFEPVSMEQARIGGQADRWVNALILNGQTYGGGGNPMPDDLVLGKTEYISYLKVSWWQGVYAFITDDQHRDDGERQTGRAVDRRRRGEAGIHEGAHLRTGVRQE